MWRVLKGCRCHREGASTASSLFDRVDSLPSNGSQQVVRVHPGIGEKFQEFQAVLDRHGVCLMQIWRRVTKEGETTHFRTMTLDVLKAPGRVRGMAIIRAERWLNKGVRPTDASI